MQSQLLAIDPLTLVFIIGIVMYAFAAIRQILKEETVDVPAVQSHSPVANTDHLIYYGNKPGISDEDIKHILGAWQPYYKNLQPVLQEKFRSRVKEFIQQKTFIINAKEGYKEMPVLTAAAAIQISFGHDDFIFPWFHSIQIFPDIFFDGDFEKIVNGVVEGNIIALAWNKLLIDNYDYSDRQNVGIHEMAHALYYQKMIAETNNDSFKLSFSEVMRHSEKIYAQPREHHLLFNEYAYKNMQEFWAESVEMFFEDPHGMHHNYTELFSSLKALLNQDPINSRHPVL